MHTLRATKQIELYQLCVAKGKLWSVQATVNITIAIEHFFFQTNNLYLLFFHFIFQSNDQMFPSHEEAFTSSLLSFIPKL